jgi:anaphase-promoting complex subunit 11
MKVTIKHWNAIAQWKWDVGNNANEANDDDEEEDVCGICRVPYEACCPACKMPGDDCPLSK